MPLSPDRCPVCDGALRAAVPSSAADHVLRCLSCGHGIHLHGAPLDLAWRDGPTSPSPAERRVFSWDDFDQAWLRLQRLRELCPSAGALLDLDSARGAFPAVVAASPFTLRCAALRDVTDNQLFDAVTLWSGFDSTTTPVEDLVTVRGRLRPGGVLLLDVRTVPEPSVVQVFSPQSLTLVVQRAGLDPIPPTRSDDSSSRLPPQALALLEHVRTVVPRAPWFDRWLTWPADFTQQGHPRGHLVMGARRP